MSAVDQGWIDALRRFIGEGTGEVPVWLTADGTVDAEHTVESAFALYDIKPGKNAETKGATHGRPKRAFLNE